MRIVLFGPPGAGKGTVAGVLVKRTSALHIATGDLLRAEMRENTELGQKARGFIEAGKLVPDDLIIAMMGQKLSPSEAAQGFILDGFPRTLVQAEMLDSTLVLLGQPLEGVFELQLEDDVIIKRLSGRRICPQCEAIYNVYTLKPQVEDVCDTCGTALIQREDDRAEAIAVRFETYRKQSTPVLGYYQERGLLRPVDAREGAEASADAILASLAS
jgi:adenylate kinase